MVLTMPRPVKLSRVKVATPMSLRRRAHSSTFPEMPPELLRITTAGSRSFPSRGRTSAPASVTAGPPLSPVRIWRSVSVTDGSG